MVEEQNEESQEKDTNTNEKQTKGKSDKKGKKKKEKGKKEAKPETDDESIEEINFDINAPSNEKEILREELKEELLDNVLKNIENLKKGKSPKNKKKAGKGKVKDVTEIEQVEENIEKPADKPIEIPIDEMEEKPEDEGGKKDKQKKGKGKGKGKGKEKSEEEKTEEENKPEETETTTDKKDKKEVKGKKKKKEIVEMVITETTELTPAPTETLISSTMLSGPELVSKTQPSQITFEPTTVFESGQNNSASRETVKIDSTTTLTPSMKEKSSRKYKSEDRINDRPSRLKLLRENEVRRTDSATSEGARSIRSRKMKEMSPEEEEYERILKLFITRNPEKEQLVEDLKSKKLSKKEKTKLTNLLKKELNEFQKILIQEEKERFEKECIQFEKKEESLVLENLFRSNDLPKTINKIDKFIQQVTNYDLNVRAEYQWQKYVECGDLPNVTNCFDINSFLDKWEKTQETLTLDEAAIRTNYIMRLLDEVEELTRKPLNASHAQIEEWFQIMLKLKSLQHKHMEIATYHLLRRIKDQINVKNIRIAEYSKDTKYFTFCFWAKVRLPVPLFNPKAPEDPPIKIKFPQVNLSILFPSDINCYCMAVRVILLHYNHLSEQCVTFKAPMCPKKIEENLFEFNERYWFEKQKIKSERLIKKPDLESNEDVGEIDFKKRIFYDRFIYPVPSELQLMQEQDIYSIMQIEINRIVMHDEINLRQYLIVGGIMNIDLLYQPPQPNNLYNDITMTALQIPKQLDYVPFMRKYEDPIADLEHLLAAANVQMTYSRETTRERKRKGKSKAKLKLAAPKEVKVEQTLKVPQSIIDLLGLGKPTNEKTPEQIEAVRKHREPALEKLLLFKMKLPIENLFLIEDPIICHWDKKKKAWLTSGLHDIQYDSENSRISFRSGVFGPFSLAINRYSFLPFHHWSMEPDKDGFILFYLQTPHLKFDFKIKSTTIVLENVDFCHIKKFKKLIGIDFTLPILIKKLNEIGIDLFPSFDTVNYVTESRQKHYPTEKHLYYCMAMLSPLFCFEWSKWNMYLGFRSLVLRIKELQLNENYSTLYVTPFRTTYVNSTEEDLEFDENPMKGIKFYPDLYNLIIGEYGMDMIDRLKNSNFNTVNMVAQFLFETRVMSFSYVYIPPPVEEEPIEEEVKKEEIESDSGKKKTKKKKKGDEEKDLNKENEVVNETENKAEENTKVKTKKKKK